LNLLTEPLHGRLRPATPRFWFAWQLRDVDWPEAAEPAKELKYETRLRAG
jgi:hypothetical protein